MNKHLIQGTPEWKAERRKYIGASEASVVMGVNPYKTPYELWQQKLGLIDEDADNKAMKHGRDNEDEARNYLGALVGIDFIGNPDTVSHPDYPYIRASLDGISPCGKIACELKTPFNLNGTAHSYALLGLCPELYYPQIQQQYLVYEKLQGLEKVIFFSYNKNDPEKSPDPIVVSADPEYISQLAQKLHEFWYLVDHKIPPELTDKDYKVAEGELLRKFDKLQELRQYYDEYEKLKDEIKKDCSGQNYVGNGIKVTTYSIPGRVDYNSIEVLKDLDLDRYRKPSTLGTRISFK